MTSGVQGSPGTSTTGGGSAVVSVSNRANCCGVIVLALVAAGGFVAWRQLGDRVGDVVATIGDRLEEAAAKGADAMAQEAPPPSAELGSGQVLEGDFENPSLDQALAEGDLAGAMESAIENDPETLRARLADGTLEPNLHLPGSDGYFALPLEKAVRQGAPGTVEILLHAGADPNGQDSSLGSALASAASDGDAGVVLLLLEAGADPNLAGQNDFRAIETAAYQGHFEVVRALLAGGSELHDALQSAGASGNFELVRFLLEAGADPRARTRFDESSLRGASREGHLEVVQTLLAAGAGPCEQALREAAQNGRVEVLRAFGGAGVRFDTKPAQFDPLYTAAYYGQLDAVRQLVELGASPSGYRTDAPVYADYPATALGVALAQGHREVAALLESLGAR